MIQTNIHIAGRQSDRQNEQTDRQLYRGPGKGMPGHTDGQDSYEIPLKREIERERKKERESLKVHFIQKHCRFLNRVMPVHA